MKLQEAGIIGIGVLYAAFVWVYMTYNERKDRRKKQQPAGKNFLTRVK